MFAYYAVLALTIAIVLWLFSRATVKIAHALAFFPTRDIEKTPDSSGLPFEDVFITSIDGTKLHGWYIPHEDPIATVLFLHGNAGNISHRIDELSLWHYIKTSVFIIDYRGFGKSEGTPSEHGLYQDAQAAYDYLVETRGIAADKIVCFGRSLGGAVAINLALNKDCGALIVSSTFTSIRDMVLLMFPKWLAPILSYFNPLRMPSLQLIGNLPCPFLVVHGQKDQMIPCAMGKKLYDEAPNPKMWYIVPEADHNDIFIKGGKKYWYLINAFILKTIQKQEDVGELKL